MDGWTGQPHELASLFFFRFFPSAPAPGPWSLPRLRAGGGTGSSTPAGLTNTVACGIGAVALEEPPSASISRREGGARAEAPSRTSSCAVFVRGFLPSLRVEAMGALKPEIEVGSGSNFERGFGGFASSSISPSSRGLG